VIAWQSQIGTGYSPITTSGGRAFTMGNRRGIDTVYCFDALTGTLCWNHSYSCDLFARGHAGGPAAAVTVNEGKAYSLSRGGDVLCLEASTGAVIWSLKLPKVVGAQPPYYGFTSTPLILGDSLFVDAGVLARFNKLTGDLIWQSKDFGCGYSPPTSFCLEGIDCIGAFNRTGAVIFAAESGKEMNVFPWKTEFGDNIAPLIFHENKLFLSSGYDQGCACLGLSSGHDAEVLYRNHNMRNHCEGSVVYNGFLFGFDGDFGKNMFRCLRSLPTDQGMLTCARKDS
jgi:outer membrane protein assembly factor BamB